MNVLGDIGHFISGIGQGIQKAADAVGKGIEKVGDTAVDIVSKPIDLLGDGFDAVGLKAVGAGLHAAASADRDVGHFAVHTVAGLEEGVVGGAVGGVFQLAGGVVSLGDPEDCKHFVDTVGQIAKDPGAFTSAMVNNVVDGFKKDPGEAFGQALSIVVPGTGVAGAAGKVAGAVGGAAGKVSAVVRAGAEAANAARGAGEAAEVAGDTAKAAEDASKVAQAGSKAADGEKAAEASSDATATSAPAGSSHLETAVTVAKAMRDQIGKQLTDAKLGSRLMSGLQQATPEEIHVLGRIIRGGPPQGVPAALWQHFSEAVQRRGGELRQAASNTGSSIVGAVRHPLQTLSAAKNSTMVQDLVGGKNATVRFKDANGVEQTRPAVGYFRHPIQGLIPTAVAVTKGAVIPAGRAQLGTAKALYDAAKAAKDAEAGSRLSAAGDALKTGMGDVGSKLKTDLSNSVSELGTAMDKLAAVKFIRAHKRTAYLGLATTALQAATASGGPTEAQRVAYAQAAFGLDPSGSLDGQTKQKIQEFQKAVSLPATGELDAQTFQSLQQAVAQAEQDPQSGDDASAADASTTDASPTDTSSSANDAAFAQNAGASDAATSADASLGGTGDNPSGTSQNG